ncbi:MAG: plasma-membrane proton-efflux P-type ATPase [Candidatus Lokiarchaeota archaeon]
MNVSDLDGNGLDSNQVSERLEKYGYNEISTKKQNTLLLLIKKFWGFTPLMLMLTIILELIINKLDEAIIIGILLLFNSFLSYFQERRANSALDLLKSKLEIDVRVKREGQWILIPSRELVPDDLVRLRSGDFVSADIMISEGSIEADQSVITGESNLVQKKLREITFAGSIIRKGEGTGRVISTGKNTFYGRTVKLVELARPKLHIENIIYKLVKNLILIVVVLFVITIIFSFIKNFDMLKLLPLLIVLLVAAIPIALPTMMTVSLAIGSLELSKKGVLITNLDAIEEVAMMNIICVDKTGTLTFNKLHVSDIITNKMFKEEEVVLYGALASHIANEDPIDMAFIEAAKKFNLNIDNFHILEFIPFDPNKRRTEAIIKTNNKKYIIMKGAINVIFDLCDLSQVINLQEIKDKIADLTSSGYRLIAVAKGEKVDKLELLGVVAFFDQIRPEIPKLIERINNLGISLKMITGDLLPIALEIARKIGINSNFVTHGGLNSILKNPGERKKLESFNVFAESYPEDKYAIVKSLQGLKHIVGMTGDGINDSPALKQAEVGIAVKNATDVAKNASSVVFTKETLESILDLIIIGRIIYQRISVWIFNKIIRTFKRVLFVTLAFLIFGVYIISVLDIIILLFLTDYVTISLSTDHVKGSQLPESGDLKNLIFAGAIVGIFVVLEGFGILFMGSVFFNIFNNIGHLNTYTFAFLTYSGYFTVLAIREKRHFWNSRPSNFLSIALIGNSILVGLICCFGWFGFYSISFIELLSIFGYCFFFCLIFNDFIKFFSLKKIDKVIAFWEGTVDKIRLRIKII